jgi:hypothetical protein
LNFESYSKDKIKRHHFEFFLFFGRNSFLIARVMINYANAHPRTKLIKHFENILQFKILSWCVFAHISCLSLQARASPILLQQ